MLKCRQCDAPIMFITTIHGKMTAVERERTKIITRDGEIEGYEPHYVHCPHAEKHRRKKVNTRKE